MDIMTLIRLLYEVNLAAHVGGAISFGANSSVSRVWVLILLSSSVLSMDLRYYPPCTFGLQGDAWACGQRAFHRKKTEINFKRREEKRTQS